MSGKVDLLSVATINFESRISNNYREVTAAATTTTATTTIVMVTTTKTTKTTIAAHTVSAQTPHQNLYLKKNTIVLLSLSFQF